jgi:hypothetical protein
MVDYNPSLLGASRNAGPIEVLDVPRGRWYLGTLMLHRSHGTPAPSLRMRMHVAATS